jgi:hypothetical protein
MKNTCLSLIRGFSYALWSLRRRTGQIIPVGVSFLLLIGAVQSIGTLRDVSSVLVQQQITRSWRGPYDLLIRPQSAVSEPERSAGWIDPQSILETYGGISQQQIASISAIAHVVQVVPVATVGWQPVDVLLPIELASKGIYRISAAWNGQWNAENEVVRYVEVTDLAHLTNEAQLFGLDVQHVVISDGAVSGVFTMSVQGIQAVIGVPAIQQGMFSQALSENLVPVSAMPISLGVERLKGELSSLAGCIGRVDCWQAQQVRQGPVSYQSDGVQLLRYSRTRYAASSQQIAAGEVSIVAPGSDTQGPLYRELLPEHISVPIYMENKASEELPLHALSPFSMPQRMPLLTDVVRFVSPGQACAINGERCYSGVYVRLSGVERYSQQSLALLQATAATIVARTGLHVDILDGSSLRAVSITAQDTAHWGTIARVQSMWRVVGVAVQIEHGVDALQAMLLALCSIVCLLAIGAAGVLVGIGRRKEALLLRQIGWRRYVLVAVFTIDGLALCGPGCLLAIGCAMLAARIWASSLSQLVAWVSLAVGALVYCCSLVIVASSAIGENRRIYRGGGRQDGGSQVGKYQGEERQGYIRNAIINRSIVGAGFSPALVSLIRARFARQRSSSQAYRAKVIVELVSSLTLTAAVFLIALGYVLTNSFNRELVVTVLGRQVHTALEGPQLLLLLIFVSASLLTVCLCSKLLLQGRREELRLLAMVGWERRAVMLRIMWDYCSPALVSGEIGVLLAIAVAMLAAAFPTMFMALGLLVCGPLSGALLAGLATIGIAWQETGGVYRWR